MESETQPGKAGRPKGPIDVEYHVLKHDGGGSFSHLTQDEPAKGKSLKEALEGIGAACDGTEEFLIVKGKDFRVVNPRMDEDTITRKKFVL